jgi:hypothetical protein
MYSTDYNDFAIQMLPPNYRLPSHEAWMKSQLVPMVWANDNFFEDFMNGSNYSAYSGATTYGYQDRVISDRAVYESLQASNTGNALTDGDWWIKVQDNYIGVYERIKYNSTKLVFEYALNKWFGGTFRQPTNTSDIYITKNNTTIRTFVTGDTTEASAVGYDTSSGFVGDTINYTSNVDFTINIPTSLYTSDENIQQFVNNIIAVEATYDIIQY